MELIVSRKYGELATEKIASELKNFNGDKYGNAVKTFVASTLTNFCQQDERFARVVCETKATLSDCCAKIMKGCGSHISDIDVYRGAVKYYFPNAEVIFSLTIDASGDLPTPEEMAKPAKQEPAKKDGAGERTEKPKTDGAVKAAKLPDSAPEKAPVAAPKKEPKRKAKEAAPVDDGLIQLTLF